MPVRLYLASFQSLCVLCEGVKWNGLIQYACTTIREYNITVVSSVYDVYVTVYAEIGHMSAKLILRYRPRRSERYVLLKLLLFA